MTGLSAGYALGCVGDLVRPRMRRTARAWLHTREDRCGFGTNGHLYPATHGASFDAEVGTSIPVCDSHQWLVCVNQCTCQRVICTGNACMLAVTLPSPSVYESDIKWIEDHAQCVLSVLRYWVYHRYAADNGTDVLTK
jgi:hypothetical protein